MISSSPFGFYWAVSFFSLFSYYTVLNLGVFLVAWFRAWRQLNLLGFLFTFGISALWRGGGYSREHLISTDLFLGLFFLMYVAVSLLFALSLIHISEPTRPY